MARVLPFRALRFPSLDQAQNPLELARLHAAPDPWGQVRRWQAEGHLVAEEPAMYVVETRPSDRLDRQPPVRFLLAGMRADPEVAQLERVAEPNGAPPLEPIPVLAADDQQVLRALLSEVVAQGPAVWEAKVGQAQVRLWRVGGGALSRRLRATLEEMPVRPHGQVPGQGPYLAAVVPLSEPGLRMLPYHRGIRGLSTFSGERFLTLVASFARVYELEARLDLGPGLAAAKERLAQLSVGQHAVLLVLPGGDGRLLRFRMGMELDHIPAAPRSPTLRSLDLALLNSLVLKTVLGIPEPESPTHPNVFPVATVEELVEKVGQGVFQAGFALNPPPVWEVRAVIAAAQALPPRTMRLDPLPPPGLLFLDPRAGV